jgi:O-antigen ligase
VFDQGRLVKNTLFTAVKELPKRRGWVIVLGSILGGIVLAKSIMVSPLAATFLLSGGIVLAITLFLRQAKYLIVSWIYLTGFVHLILNQIPTHYYPIVGRGAFWGLLICVIAAWAIDNILRGNRFMSFDNMAIKATLLMFVVWSVLSLTTAQDLFISSKHVAHYVIVLVAAYMFYDFFSRDRDNIIRTLRALLYVTFIVCVIIVFSAGRGLIAGANIYKELSLWFQNPNGLGKLLMTCIPILITAGVYHLSSRSLKFLFVSIILLGLFFTFSRSSWIATSVAIVFLQWKGRMGMPIRAGTVFGLLVVALLFPAVSMDTYEYITGPRYTGRIEIWQAAWGIACDYPLLGVGPGYSLYLIPEYIANPHFAKLIGFENTHSLYLANAADMGFPSVMIWLAFFITFLYYSLRIEGNLKTEYLRLLCRGSTATFLALSVSGIFENGCLLSAFSGSEYHMIVPYMLMAVPFAVRNLDERAETAYTHLKTPSNAQ